ncbi:hypothetical protein L1987_09105 [Smallanthus sonchifolius]|uniref:Uncharacterized protein n=1 Tax=Smallanthus sonchifolius TaxID=185202 RepID=A0ACB9JN17_9ASTR|nr:hypothetical protein L1987_09105 [Smallanthus sonchifolius]
MVISIIVGMIMVFDNGDSAKVNKKQGLDDGSGDHTRVAVVVRQKTETMMGAAVTGSHVCMVVIDGQGSTRVRAEHGKGYGSHGGSNMVACGARLGADRGSVG